MKQYKKGFTLIELLVVIAIIGILSTLAVVSLGNARTRARDSKRVADIRNIQTALEIYATDHAGAYPVAPAAACPGGDIPNIEGCCLDNAVAGGWLLPAGCAAATRLVTVPVDPGVAANTYAYGIDGTVYEIQFGLESGAGDLGSGTNCARPSGISAGVC